MNNWMDVPTIEIESPNGDKVTYLVGNSNKSASDSDSVSSVLDIQSDCDSDFSCNERAPMLTNDRENNHQTDSNCGQMSRRKSFSLPNSLEDVKIKTLRDQYNAQDNVSARDCSVAKTLDNCQTVESINSFDNMTILQADNLKDENLGTKSGRRKGVIYPPVFRIVPDPLVIDPNQDSLDSSSNNNSVTSLSSLVSLLKDKIQSLPLALKRRRNKEFKMKLIVGFLFLMIVFLIAIAYILYNQQIIQRAYFEKIKFNKFKKVIKMYNSNGMEIIRGYLGLTLPNTNSVYNCLAKDNRANNTVCLEWTNQARLYINYKYLENNIRCYTLFWQSLSDHFHPNDCFDWSRSKSHWYGGGQNSASAWPLEKTTHSFVPFITGDAKKYPWGSTLRRYFINSKGIAIKVSEDTPLYVSLNEKNNKMICLEGQFDNYAYINRPLNTRHSILNYTICSGENITALHHFLSEKTLWDGLKQEDIETIHSLISEPVWELAPAYKEVMTEDLVNNFTENVISLGFLKQGHVLLNENWQSNVGDFTIDTSRLETLDETITIMHRRGFKIVLTIQPFISTESLNFATCVRKKIVIFERDNDKRIPTLTSYKSTPTAAMLDITNNRTFTWLLKQIKQLLYKYKIDAFYLDFGSAYNLPRYYQTEEPLRNPDEYKKRFLQRSEGNLNIFSVSGATDKLKPPIFLMLLSAESTWEGLKTVIPTVLSYGIIGYPFIIPGTIGGDIFTQPLVNSRTKRDDVLRYLPDKELFKRWFQMNTFFPVMKFRFLPSLYNDSDLIEMVKTLTLLRQKIVTPILLKYTRESLDSGLPIIKPLWMLEPNDPACHMISDEFLIGNEVLVAPVITKGAKQREVYLPSGVWKDGIDGSLRKGSRWIHNYNVVENQVAYFIRMPDNTRF